MRSPERSPGSVAPWVRSRPPLASSLNLRPHLPPEVRDGVDNANGPSRGRPSTPLRQGGVASPGPQGRPRSSNWPVGHPVDRVPWPLWPPPLPGYTPWPAKAVGTAAFLRTREGLATGSARGLAGPDPTADPFSVGRDASERRPGWGCSLPPQDSPGGRSGRPLEPDRRSSKSSSTRRIARARREIGSSLGRSSINSASWNWRSAARRGSA